MTNTLAFETHRRRGPLTTPESFALSLLLANWPRPVLLDAAVSRGCFVPPQRAEDVQSLPDALRLADACLAFAETNFEDGPAFARRHRAAIQRHLRARNVDGVLDVVTELFRRATSFVPPAAYTFATGLTALSGRGWVRTRAGGAVVMLTARGERELRDTPLATARASASAAVQPYQPRD